MAAILAWNVAISDKPVGILLPFIMTILTPMYPTGLTMTFKLYTHFTTYTNQPFDQWPFQVPKLEVASIQTADGLGQCMISMALYYMLRYNVRPPR